MAVGVTRDVFLHAEGTNDGRVLEHLRVSGGVESCRDNGAEGEDKKSLCAAFQLHGVVLTGAVDVGC